MSQETNWFEQYGLGDAHERCYWRRVAGVIIGAILLALLLGPMFGCASSPSPRSEVCAMRLLGATQDGVSVVAVQCVTPEQFAESQK
jgi:hypothetical protein